MTCSLSFKYSLLLFFYCTFSCLVLDLGVFQLVFLVGQGFLNLSEKNNMTILNLSGVC